MKVKLKNTLYIGGRRYRKAPDPVDLPDEYVDRLPSSAVVVEGPKARAKDDRPKRSPAPVDSA